MTQKNRKADAHAVLLPAFETTTLSDDVKRSLEEGGCSILLGESRLEYVARKMSRRRRSAETPETFIQVTREAANLAGAVLVAVDQEIGGICRMHDLVPFFPDIDELADYDTGRFEKIAASVAAAAKAMGVNCFLGPVLDVVTGRNPWLSGRTWSTDPNEIARISSAYVRGVQGAGVAATAKHFPGFHDIELDPATETDARVAADPGSFEPGFIPFSDAIRNDVALIMVGPAVVEAFDDEKPASMSPAVIHLLRSRFEFKGVVMSDDLDARATVRGSTVEQVAIDALKAGADFLLLAAVDGQMLRVADAIYRAVEKGELAESRLHEAGTRVRTLVEKYNC